MNIFPNTLPVCYWSAKQIIPPKTPRESNKLYNFFCDVLIFLNDFSFIRFLHLSCNCFVKPNPLEDLWSWSCWCLFFHFLCHVSQRSCQFKPSVCVLDSAFARWFAVARQPNVCCDDRPVLKRDSLSEVMFEWHHMFVFCAMMTLLSSGERFAHVTLTS